MLNVLALFVNILQPIHGLWSTNIRLVQASSTNFGMVSPGMEPAGVTLHNIIILSALFVNMTGPYWFELNGLMLDKTGNT